MISVQIIADPSVPFIRILLVDLFDLISDPFVFRFMSRLASSQPFVVRCSVYTPKITKRTDRIPLLFVLLFDRLIDRSMPDQAQPRLLSISSSFFKNDASISARSFAARRIRFSARSFSSSDISSNGFVLPRLSRRASTPPVSYLTV